MVPLALAALALACGGGSGPAAIPAGIDPGDTAFVHFEGGEFITSWGESVLVAPFDMGRNEVSCRFYAFLASRADVEMPPDPVYPGLQPYFSDYPDLPAVNMTAYEAESAAAVLGCRLPTAAEWEYAASRGLNGPIADQYPWGSLPPEEASNPANYLAGDQWDARNADGYLFTAPVGSYPFSSAGLADLAGNAAEWTNPVEGSSRVYGGSWDTPSEGLRIGAWRSCQAGDRARHIGFRLAR